MALADFAKSTSVLALTRLVEFTVGLIRIKLNAIYLGAKGVGLVDQLTFFAQQTSTFTLLSLSEALVKQIAEVTKEEEVSDIVSSALKGYLVMIMLFMMITLSLLLIFRGTLSPLVFGEGIFFNIYFFAVASVPLLIFNSIPFSILKAFRGTSYIAKARMIIVSVNILFLVPLVVIFNLRGAIIYVLISYFITLSVNFIFAKRVYLNKYKITLSKIFRAKVLISHVKELFVFSGFGLSVGLLFIVSEMAIRSLIVVHMGIEAIGLYSPVIMWASMFTGIVLPTFSTYLYPRFCAVKNAKETSELINDGLKLASLAIAPFLFIGIPFKEFFVSLFYTDEFLNAAVYVPFHFLGLAFYAWWFVFSQALTPTGRIKQHGMFLASMYLMNFLIVFVFIEGVGLLAYALKFLLPPILYLVIYMLYCRRSMGIAISKQNLLVMFYLLFAGITLLFLSQDEQFVNLTIGLGCMFFVGTLFLLSKKEKKLIVNAVRQLFKKYN